MNELARGSLAGVPLVAGAVFGRAWADSTGRELADGETTQSSGRGGDGIVGLQGSSRSRLCHDGDVVTDRVSSSRVKAAIPGGTALIPRKNPRSARTALPTGHRLPTRLRRNVTRRPRTGSAGCRASGRLPGPGSGTARAKARWATLRSPLIGVPALIATSARRLVLHLWSDWPWRVDHDASW